MIDMETERRIPLREYCRMRGPGRNGRPMALATAYRHIFQGVQGVRLERVKIGGSTFTTVEAVTRFAERLTAISNGETDPHSPPGPTHSPAKRSRAIAAANKEADRLLGV